MIGHARANGEEVVVAGSARSALVEDVIEALEAEAHFARDFGLGADTADKAGLVFLIASQPRDLAVAAIAAIAARAAAGIAVADAAITAIPAIAAARANAESATMILAHEGDARGSIKQGVAGGQTQAAADRREIIVEAAICGVVALGAIDDPAVLPVVADMEAAEQIVLVIANRGRERSAVSTAATTAAIAADVRRAVQTIDPLRASAASAAGTAGALTGVTAAATATTATATIAAIHGGAAAALFLAEDAAEMPAGIEARPAVHGRRDHGGRSVIKVRCECGRGCHRADERERRRTGLPATHGVVPL